MSVQERFGPSLPELVAQRTGLDRRKAAFALVGAFVALIVLALLIRGGDGRTTFDHDGNPAFELSYPESLLEPVTAQPGEIARFEARRGPLSITLAFSETDLAGRPFSELPVATAQHAESLREQIPQIEFREQGRTRLNRQPAYELNYRFGPKGRRTFGRDVLVFAEDAKTLDDGILISTRTVKPGPPLTDAERDVAKRVRKVANSLQFG